MVNISKIWQKKFPFLDVRLGWSWTNGFPAKKNSSLYFCPHSFSTNVKRSFFIHDFKFDKKWQSGKIHDSFIVTHTDKNVSLFVFNLPL